MRCSCDDIGESPCEEHGYGELDCECGTRFHAPIVAKSFLLIQCPDCGHKYTGREDCGNGHWETVLPCGSCDGTGQIKERRDPDTCMCSRCCADDPMFGGDPNVESVLRLREDLAAERENVRVLRQTLQDLLDELRDYGIPFDSSGAKSLARQVSLSARHLKATEPKP